MQVQDVTCEICDPHSNADDSGVTGYCALLTGK